MDGPAFIQQLNTVQRATVASYWYVATPYSKYAVGIEQAFIDACRATAWLLKQGVNVFSPIAHTHLLAIHGNIDPLDHEIWLPADKPMMLNACGLIVVRMDGWADSYGISEEIKSFEVQKKPILYLPFSVVQ